MFSRKGAKLLEESTKRCSYGSISNAGPSTETKTEKPEFISSGPAVLEPSKDPSRPLKAPKQDALLTRSCLQPSTRVPTTTGDQTIDQQIIDEQETDGRSSVCSTIANAYKNAAVMLRNSIFIHIFQVLFSVIPISAMVMAGIFGQECYASSLLPLFGGVTGVVGAAFTCFWILLTFYSRLGRSSSDICKVMFVIIFALFILSALLDLAIFAVTPYSFEPNTPEYCNKTFCYYVFYKHIATGAAAVLATILYIPGSLHYLRCQCFSESTQAFERDQ